MKHPPVNVWALILNWNGADETIACIETLLTSQLQPHILIIDNGSWDGSPTRLTAAFTGLDLLALKTNCGFSAGMNRGIARALAGGAEYILLLNNDVRVAPEMLGQLVDYAEQHQTCGMVSPLIYQLEQPQRFWVVGGHWRIYHLDIEGWDTLDSGQYTSPIPFDVIFGTALLIRRTVLEQVGTFDERFFVYYEDVDLCLRARHHGWSMVVLPTACLWHAGSFSTRAQLHRRMYLLARSRVLLFRKHLRGIHFIVWWLLQVPRDLRTIAAHLRRRHLRAAIGHLCGILHGLWDSGRVG